MSDEAKKLQQQIFAALDHKDTLCADMEGQLPTVGEVVTSMIDMAVHDLVVKAKRANDILGGCQITTEDVHWQPCGSCPYCELLPELEKWKCDHKKIPGQAEGKDVAMCYRCGETWAINTVGDIWKHWPETKPTDAEQLQNIRKAVRAIGREAT